MLLLLFKRMAVAREAAVRNSSRVFPNDTDNSLANVYSLFICMCVAFCSFFFFFLLRLVNGMSRRGMSATERLWLIFISTPLQTPPYHPPPLSLPPARCHSFSRVIISDVICFRLFFLLLFSLFLSPFLRLFIGILDLRRSLARYQELVVIS